MLKVKEIKKLIEDAISNNNFSVYEILIKNAREKMKKSGRPLTITEFKNLLGIHITTGHTGKMSEMVSISTSCLHNGDCTDHAKVKGSICEHCFAHSLLNQRKSIDIPLLRNTLILSNVIIPVDCWPLLNIRFFRFESFGDLGSVNQVINYFNFIVRNPYTDFAMWTKNYKYIHFAIDKEGYKKPENLTLVISSLMVNIQLNIKLFPHADKVFTVYSKEYLKNHTEVKINCGKRSCLACNRCYRKDSEIYINELLK